MLQEFIASIREEGLSRTNRYSVIFAAPTLVDGVFTKQMSMYCDQIQLPGVNYASQPNRTFGELREVPYDKLHDPLNMSFYVDTDLNVKRFFDSWINSIQDPQTKKYSYYDNYITDIEIHVEDLNDRSRYVITLYECYPKTVGSIQLDYASKEVMKLQVTMNYRYFVVSDAATGSESDANGTAPVGRESFDTPLVGISGDVPSFVISSDVPAQSRN
jgi:hypothetical protein